MFLIQRLRNGSINILADKDDAEYFNDVKNNLYANERVSASHDTETLISIHFSMLIIMPDFYEEIVNLL